MDSFAVSSRKRAGEVCGAVAELGERPQCGGCGNDERGGEAGQLPKQKGGRHRTARSSEVRGLVISNLFLSTLILFFFGFFFFQV